MSDAPAVRAPAAGRVVEPGLADGERHRVGGRTALALALAAGDRFEVVDMEGGQAGELLFVDAAGRFDTAALGAHSSVSATGFVAALADASTGVAAVCEALARPEIDWTRAQGLRLFGTDSPAGSSATFSAARAGLLVLAAPAPALEMAGSATATPLELRVARVRTQAGRDLPAPLAAVVQDLRIGPGSARAYRVNTGDYVQVIDVEGRQCSDFQAFALHKLEQGLDCALDATVTRTMTGRSYPTPGLPSKAFDREFQPLVELVQDTCGRHDAFATACSARYYDDLGYPGHVNCSENFNLALAPHGVAPRKGWEALNFFYNTSIDPHQRLSLDEPWSRPGDYVLLRALTDLLCVSSSCPDDIDAANGWQPTDIHVRVYASQNEFPRAIAHRMTPDALPELTRQSAFHPRMAALTPHFANYRGFWLPQHFSAEGPIAEYWACREAVVMIDLSALRKFEITGPDAEALLQYALTRDVRKLAVGQVVYTALCHEHGGMLDDATLLRLGPDTFRLVCGEDRSGAWLRELAVRMRYRAWIRSSTDQMHNLAIQGPRSRELLSRVLWTAPAQPAIADLGWFRFMPARIGHYEGAPVVVSRTGYSGELGFEVFCHPRDALAVFDAIWAAGLPLGLKPAGLDALDMLRIEAGLAFAGHEFDDQTDPFEAGIGFTVPLKTKPDDFIGRDALLTRKAQPRQVLVGLEFDGRVTVEHGDGVFVGRARIGVVTSATHSPVLQKTIALARVDALYGALETPLEVGRLDGYQKRLPCRVVRFPHYDPDKTRVKS